MLYSQSDSVTPLFNHQFMAKIKLPSVFVTLIGLLPLYILPLFLEGAAHKFLSKLGGVVDEYLWLVSLLGLMAKIKCSICSYQFNIWYVGHVSTHILIWFLVFGQGSEVYLTLTTGCLGLALLPRAAHFTSIKVTSLQKDS